MSYGDNIRKFRNEKGYSQDYLASNLGLSQNALSKMENGQTKIKAEMIEKVAKVLKIEPNKLLNNDTNTYNIEQTNHDYATSTGVAIHNENFEKERQ